MTRLAAADNAPVPAARRVGPRVWCFQDFAMLFVAAWLLLRAEPSDWRVGALVAGFAVLELVLVLQPAIILALESALLVSIAWPALEGHPGWSRR